MSSQVVSIPSSVFYVPPQLESDSGHQAGGIGLFCAPLPGRFHTSAAFGPLSTSTIFPFDIFLFERILFVRQDCV